MMDTSSENLNEGFDYQAYQSNIIIFQNEN